MEEDILPKQVITWYPISKKEIKNTKNYLGGWKLWNNEKNRTWGRGLDDRENLRPKIGG